MRKAAETIMSYVITGTNSAGVLSLKRHSAVAAIKKAVELLGDGTRDVHITDPDGRTYSDAEFSQLYMAARPQPLGGSGGDAMGGGVFIASRSVRAPRRMRA